MQVNEVESHDFPPGFEKRRYNDQIRAGNSATSDSLDPLLNSIVGISSILLAINKVKKRDGTADAGLLNIIMDSRMADELRVCDVTNISAKLQDMVVIKNANLPALTSYPINGDNHDCSQHQDQMLEENKESLVSFNSYCNNVDIACANSDNDESFKHLDQMLEEMAESLVSSSDCNGKNVEIACATSDTGESSKLQNHMLEDKAERLVSSDCYYNNVDIASETSDTAGESSKFQNHMLEHKTESLVPSDSYYNNVDLACANSDTDESSKLQDHIVEDKTESLVSSDSYYNNAGLVGAISGTDENSRFLDNMLVEEVECWVSSDSCYKNVDTATAPANRNTDESSKHSDHMIEEKGENLASSDSFYKNVGIAYANIDTDESSKYLEHMLMEMAENLVSSSDSCCPNDDIGLPPEVSQNPRLDHGVSFMKELSEPYFAHSSVPFDATMAGLVTGSTPQPLDVSRLENLQLPIEQSFSLVISGTQSKNTEVPYEPSLPLVHATCLRVNEVPMKPLFTHLEPAHPPRHETHPKITQEAPQPRIIQHTLRPSFPPIYETHPNPMIAQAPLEPSFPLHETGPRITQGPLEPSSHPTFEPSPNPKINQNFMEASYPTFEPSFSLHETRPRTTECLVQSSSLQTFGPSFESHESRPRITQYPFQPSFPSHEARPRTTQNPLKSSLPTFEPSFSRVYDTCPKIIQDPLKPSFDICPKIIQDPLKPSFPTMPATPPEMSQLPFDPSFNLKRPVTHKLNGQVGEATSSRGYQPYKVNPSSFHIPVPVTQLTSPSLSPQEDQNGKSKEYLKDLVRKYGSE